MTIWLRFWCAAALILVFIGFTPAHAGSSMAFEKARLTIQTASKAHHFTVEVAKTSAQQEHGLMFREHLSADAGMLFFYNEDRDVRMWMKNTKIPLDMLFIDSGGRIVYIAARTAPESTETISADSPVRMVLEIAGGQSEARGIRVGDRVIYKVK